MAVRVLATSDLRALEARFATARPTLMERAGTAIAEAARRLAADTGARILVVAGPGNNGGDAWVAAAHLLASFHKVVVFDMTGAAPKAAEARAAQAACAERSGTIVREWPAGPAPALIIDGLLGIGLARDVEAPFAALIARMNESGAPILAIDVPSGLDSETGRVRGVAVRAARTLTFIAHKIGLHTADGPDHCGVVELDDLGVGEAVGEAPHGDLLGPRDVASWLAPRRRNAHKGDFGTLGIVGGQRGMVGAALLAARAALLAGAGKVRVGFLSPDAPPVDGLHPELMLVPVDDALAGDVLVVGPGAGQSPSATSVSMFERSVLPAALASSHPLVLDADALNAIAFSETLRAEVPRRKAPTIATPHPAEAARLLGCETAAVQSDRVAAALEIARRLRAHVVLKGAGSICADPDGRWSINATGNPGLASAGTGDVLAGLIGALLCQGLEAPRALRYAVCLHGAAADTLVARGKGPVGLSASEIALECRRLLNLWTANP
ncbi:MAG: NAD(P)H-hydrate dehydratase [Pseudomonadota bacterium]|nr:NAD(P)H-hydrate dehydratase [Pseudomonadota bacterium]